MLYHWVEWDLWDKRARRYALIEKKIIFEKNKKNGMVAIDELHSDMINKLWDDVAKWKSCKGAYNPSDEWKPEVKILDGVTTRTKIADLVGRDGKMIAFGHIVFEIKFSVKLPQ